MKRKLTLPASRRNWWLQKLQSLSHKGLEKFYQSRRKQKDSGVENEKRRLNNEAVKKFVSGGMHKNTTAKRLGIDNTPDDEWVIENLRAIAEHVFQPLRDAFGCPIYVSSGYRGPELNRAIGGSTRSQHMEGRDLILTQTCSEVVQTVRSSTGFARMLSLIKWCGNLVIQVILIGFTSVMFMMALIVRCLKACRDDEGKILRSNV